MENGKSLVDNFNGFLNEKNKRLIIIILSTLGWGLIAHCYVLVHEFAFHDVVTYMNNFGATIISGRWMLRIMYYVTESIFLEGNFSIPMINGLLTLFIIGCITYYIVQMFDIKKTSYLVLLSGTLVVFPQVACMLFYMYTAPCYALGFYMGVAGVSILNEEKKSGSKTVVAIALLTCSIGTYQASIPIILALMVLSLIYKENTGSDASVNNYRWLKKWVRYLLSFIFAIALYFGITYLSIKITDSDLTPYQGISTFGTCSFGEYLKRILFAYKDFFNPDKYTQREMFPFLIGALRSVVVILIFVLQILQIYKNFRRNKWSGIRTAILLIVFPLACNFIFVMCELSGIHGVMMYAQVMLFVYLFMLLEHTQIDVNSKILTKKNVMIFSCAVLLLVNFLYCRFSNMCYIKTELTQKRYLEYVENLADRIESIEGYDKSVPVAYIGERKKIDYFDEMNDSLAAIRLHPYDTISSLDGSRWINDYAWKETMAFWCGFSPVLVDNISEWINSEEVRSMPIYPKDGSVRMVNGAIVVKFSEN